MFNTSFSIMLFNDWMWCTHPDLYSILEPGYTGGMGSLWLRVN